MLKFSLIENARDSLEHAIEHMTTDGDFQLGDYKRIIIDLSHVAELLFKERLRIILPAFILSNIDKYPSIKAHTVSAQLALERLQKLGGIEFRSVDASALKTIRLKRNEIEHYEFSINDKEAKIVIGDVLCFLFRFSGDELNLDWGNERLTNPKWTRLIEFTEFYEAQLAQISETLNEAGLSTLDCPICNNNTFDIESETCLLCGHSEEVLECDVCHSEYLYSTVEYEEAGLCSDCEYKDGYASAHFEKY